MKPGGVIERILVEIQKLRMDLGHRVPAVKASIALLKLGLLFGAEGVECLVSEAEERISTRGQYDITAILRHDREGRCPQVDIERPHRRMFRHRNGR